MKKKIQIPHIFVILVCIAMFFAVLSWIMPAGAYDRVLDPNTGRNIVDPNSFHYLPKTPITFIQFISAYSGGFTNAASMIFMTLVVGGTFGIINELGIIPAALAIILKKFDKNREMAIPFLILVFGLFESFMGVPELCIIFLPMILPLVLDLGFDTMTALAIVRVWEIRLLLLSARRSASFLFILLCGIVPSASSFFTGSLYGIF